MLSTGREVRSFPEVSRRSRLFNLGLHSTGFPTFEVSLGSRQCVLAMALHFSRFAQPPFLRREGFSVSSIRTDVRRARPVVILLPLDFLFHRRAQLLFVSRFSDLVQETVRVDLGRH
ncbi:hypothetical protein [Halomicrobium zhouii]|uniref:hypothetical protein n=1 Tax=Halomicrobium zhouii TaxID=767519 RepID=UPI001160C976|nr:hypothetical protein [Halomicrobium zhouii]